MYSNLIFLPNPETFWVPPFFLMAFNFDHLDMLAKFCCLLSSAVSVMSLNLVFKLTLILTEEFMLPG